MGDPTKDRHFPWAKKKKASTGYPLPLYTLGIVFALYFTPCGDNRREEAQFVHWRPTSTNARQAA